MASGRRGHRSQVRIWLAARGKYGLGRVGAQIPHPAGVAVCAKDAIAGTRRASAPAQSSSPWRLRKVSARPATANPAGFRTSGPRGGRAAYLALRSRPAVHDQLAEAQAVGCSVADGRRVGMVHMAGMSRRQFIGYGLGTGAALALPWTAAAQAAQGVMGHRLRKYLQPLPVPGDGIVVALSRRKEPVRVHPAADPQEAAPAPAADPVLGLR